jgi:flavin-dependent dehydrogenase
MKSEQTVDVAVIGGGPAGAMLATLVAQAGFEAMLFESVRFPRFQIGESLLPVANLALQRVGIDLDSEGFQQKEGAEFHDEREDRCKVYPFREGLAGTPFATHQVDRARFDALLLDRARSFEVCVRLEESVTAIAATEDNVTVETRRADGSVRTIRARYLVDASGRRCVVARTRRTLKLIKRFGRSTVYHHASSISSHDADDLQGSGSIRILVRDNGWIWLIPLGENRVSVGFVSAAHRGRDELQRCLSDSPMLRSILDGAVVHESRFASGFSHVNLEPFGRRWACIGDASIFLDPVFSSGVSLALMQASDLADHLSESLRRGGESDPDLAAPAASRMKHACRVFGTLVDAFYHTKLVEHLFFAERPDPEMRAGLITTLAGDVWRDDNRFQSRLLSSRRRSFRVEQSPTGVVLPF